MIIKGRKSAYIKTLNNNNDYWQEVRREVRLRDNHQCRICGCKINLEIHHISYWHNGISIVGKELQYLNHVILLCNTCHKIVHADFYHTLNPKNKFKKLSNEFNG